MMSDSPLVLIGEGGHARSLMAAMRTPPSRVVQEGEDERFIADYRGERVVVAIGYVGVGLPVESVRARVIRRYEKASVSFGRIVAESAFFASDVCIAEGAVVLNRAVVNSGADIGRHAIINTGAIVEHDVRIGDNANVAPGAIVLGAARVGNHAFVGAGAVIRQGVRVADNVIVGMGSVVVNDLVVPGVYVGNPARRIR